MGPLSILSEFPAWLDLLIGFIIGIGFGFAPEQLHFRRAANWQVCFTGTIPLF